METEEEENIQDYLNSYRNIAINLEQIFKNKKTRRTKDNNNNNTNF